MTPPQYQMPAEWEPHLATWTAWPTNETDWPGKLPAVQWAFVELLRHLAHTETVHVLVANELTQHHVTETLESAHANVANILFHVKQTNRNWLRDSGAIFVRDRHAKTLKALDFAFNAWAKYDDFDLDNDLPTLMADYAAVDREEIWVEIAGQRRRMVLEGGAIDVNGAGLLLTTEECLLSSVQARNPGLSKADAEEVFREYLGAERVIWLKAGIEGDDTHGHVDDVARFVDARTVVVADEGDADRRHAAVLRENREILGSFRDERGALDVVELPMPGRLMFEGEVLPASYLNFYIANDTVLVPTFNDPADREALGVLQELFRGRVVRGIHAVDLVWGFGTLHCLTQQQPAE